MHTLSTKINLLRLIMLLTVASAIVSLVSTLYSAFSVQRDQLIANTLESNHAYAVKLAQSTEDFLQSAQQLLKVSADLIAANLADQGRINEEAERLQKQHESFNSTVILDRRGRVLAASPNTLPIRGLVLGSVAVLDAMNSRAPTISDPYVSTAGNLMIFISQPILSRAGEFLGTVGGSIYLQKRNMLHQLLGDHYYKDGSYLYVLDSKRNVIYHPDSARIGTQLEGNPLAEIATRQESGRGEIINSRGVAMLAGYAVVPTARWGVVVQRPRDAALAPLDRLMRDVVFKTLPVAIVSLLLILWCASLISRPLRQLAEGAQSMDDPGISQQIKSVKSWYFESLALKNAMLMGISLLRQSISRLQADAQTDPLTGLGNRRSQELALESLLNGRTPFSVISMDVDYFKKVNDTYGHVAGDVVLKELARHMREVSRREDVLCRPGGEEFLMILPRSDMTSAIMVAERLRRRIEEADFAPVGQVTVSLGVAQWGEGDADGARVLKQADEMLYRAKCNGRNRVEA